MFSGLVRVLWDLISHISPGKSNCSVQGLQQPDKHGLPKRCSTLRQASQFNNAWVLKATQMPVESDTNSEKLYPSGPRRSCALEQDTRLQDVEYSSSVTQCGH